MRLGVVALRTTMQPAALFASNRWGFSQVVVSPPGRTVHIAGQVAWTADEQLIGASRREQLVASLRNVEIAVESAGGTLDDVMSLRIYRPQFEAGVEAELVAEVLTATFGPADQPASSWIGVTSLAQPEYLVEIEATAVIQEPER